MAQAAVAQAAVAPTCVQVASAHDFLRHAFTGCLLYNPPSHLAKRLCLGCPDSPSEARYVTSTGEKRRRRRTWCSWSTTTQFKAYGADLDRLTESVKAPGTNTPSHFQISPKFLANGFQNLQLSPRPPFVAATP